MVDIEALMRALPVAGLEADCVATINGLVPAPEGRDWAESIDLLAPPVACRVPFIEPEKALELLLRHQGVVTQDAQVRARKGASHMRQLVPEDHWVVFLDYFDPLFPAHMPVSDFVASLRQLAWVSFELADFLEKAADVAATLPVFRGPGYRDAPWSLQTLPSLPPPKAMIEFVPGAPWADIDGWGDHWKDDDNPFMQWRAAMRPAAAMLEQASGESVYHFMDLDNELDDDNVHRFLVLHWCCTWQPESALVRYLVKVSGARDVEELKAALLNPARYVHPFQMNDAFLGMEALPCRIHHVPPGVRKTVVVTFATAQAREVAQSQLAQHIGWRACIVAPSELATDEWVGHATRYCAPWKARYPIDNAGRWPDRLKSWPWPTSCA